MPPLLQLQPESDFVALSAPLDAGGGVLSPLVKVLLEVAKGVARDDKVVLVGKTLATHVQAEVGIFIRKGAMIGACIGLRWPRLLSPLVCEVRVRQLAAANGRAQWGGMVLGLGLGLTLARFCFGFIEIPALRFLIGLLLGVVFAVGINLLLIRTSAFMNVPASREVAARLHESVKKALLELPRNAPPSK